jgi:hypothetical protein
MTIRRNFINKVWLIYYKKNNINSVHTKNEDLFFDEEVDEVHIFN